MAKARRLGAASANNRFRQMMDGQDLTGSRLLALRVASRIFTHFQNLSAILFEKGEMRKEDDEPKAALKTLVDYSDTYLKLVRYALDDAQGDSLTDLFGKREGQ